MPLYSPTSPSQALDLFLERLRPVATESIPLARASGRILAAPLLTDRDSPAADVSAVDGFALHADLLEHLSASPDTPVPVSATGAIGQPPPPLSPRVVVRIVTGGGVPAGTLAMLKREDVREQPASNKSAAPDSIEVPAATLAAITPGQFIRKRAENAPAGSLVIESGSLITPSLAGALSTFGIHTPLVHRRVRVGILLTGDELLTAADTPTPYQIRDSNGVALASLLAPHPWCQVLPLRTSGDDYEPTLAALGALLTETDAVVITGGVSMGDRDHVPAAITALGAHTLFHKLPQRPGRPMLGAIMPGGQPIFALPGNPLSALVCARRIALPALERLAGCTRGTLAPIPITLENPGAKALDLYWHRLVRLTSNPAGHAAPIDTTGSGDIPALARSDGFVEIPPHQSGPGPWPFYRW